jgi:hypothetical protein
MDLPPFLGGKTLRGLIASNGRRYPSQPVISLAIVDQMLTADEVARMLRITRATLYKLVKKGKIADGPPP